MKICLQRDDLFKPLRMVMGVVDRAHANPILSNVLLSIENGKMTVIGTDTEIELMGCVQMLDSALQWPPLTLPGRKLLEICRSLPEDAEIVIVQESTKVVLRAGKSRFSLATLPAETFPHLVNREDAFAFLIPQYQLKTLLQRTCFAMAQQDVRYYLNGVLMEINEGHLYTVATDGHRLACSSTMLTHHNPGPSRRLILPRKAAIELTRLLEPEESQLNVIMGTHHLYVLAEQFSFTSKLLEGQFPDYRRVIPRMGDKRVQIEKDILKQSLQRVSILCNMHHHSVRLEIKDNTCTVSANNPEQESAEDLLDITYSGEPLDINFNVHYLLDVLNIVAAQSITLVFVDSNSPVVIEEGEDEWKSVFVVMPVHV